MRILILGMADSVHLARWLNQFEQVDLEIRLISSSPHRRIHPEIRAKLHKNDGRLKVSMPLISRRFSLPLWLADRLFSNRLRAAFLNSEIRKFKPDAVHLLETQNAGYVAARAFTKNPPRVPVLLTLFGSDLFWFSRFPKHERKIRTTLSFSTHLAAECIRDITSAKNLGFRGKALPLMPVAGGIPDEKILREALNLNQRKIILVKGYENIWGRAVIAIEALSKITESLAGFEIHIYSAELLTQIAARKLNEKLNVPVFVYPKFSLSHEKILALFSKARIYIGLSTSDGLPASFLEAMSQGAFPIQSNTACVGEWVVDGVNGSLVDLNNPALLPEIIKEALTNDAMVMDAAEKNLSLVKEKYSASIFQSKAPSYYQLILD